MLRFSASAIARHTRPRPVLAMARRTMVTVKVDDQGVALVTFNNPEKVKNSSGVQLHIPTACDDAFAWILSAWR